jgi:hypothetical protein
MKTTGVRLTTVLYSFLMVFVLYNCKTKDVESLTPLSYTFKGFDVLKLPTLKQTTPATVSVKASTFTPSTETVALTSALKGITASGQVPELAKQAGEDMSKVLTADKAAQLVARLTPDVLKAFTANGTLPADLKADLKALAGNAALKAYLPQYTLPEVNGKAIGGRSAAGGITTPLVVAFATSDEDDCTAAANTAYNDAVKKLDDEKKAQTDVVTNLFTTTQAAIQADATACKATATSTYAGYRLAAQTDYTEVLAMLDAAKSVLGIPLYNLLVALYTIIYDQAITFLGILENAEKAACDTVAATKLTNAEAARDADLNTININYNAALAEAKILLNQAIASCHNQGQGG